MQVYQMYFEQVIKYIELYSNTKRKDSLLLAELQERNEILYAPFLTNNYGSSFANPEYCYETMGEVGPLLSAVFSQLLLLKEYYFHDDPLVDEFKEHLLSFYKL